MRSVLNLISNLKEPGLWEPKNPSQTQQKQSNEMAPAKKRKLGADEILKLEELKAKAREQLSKHSEEDLARLTIEKRKALERPLWIVWDKCQAKAVLLDDLIRGALPLERQAMSPEKAWEFYQKLPEFRTVMFSQFRERLAAHRQQVSKEYMICQRDEEAFRKDQARGYKNDRTHNKRGDLILHLTTIKDLVAEDVRAGKHIGLSAPEFQATRSEYLSVNPKKMKEKLYQEIRLQKFHRDYDRTRKENGAARKVAASYDTIDSSSS